MKIALLGDMALYGKFSLENKNIYYYFSDISSKLMEYDYVVANLETPLCDELEKFGHKSAYIKSETKNVELLKYLNIGIVNLANNHIFDYGMKGYESTKQILERHGIEYFGIENKQLMINKKNCNIALSGFCCYSTNGLGYYNKKNGIGVNILDAFNTEKILKENHDAGYLNITSIHAGQEHINYPNHDHVLMARAFADKVPYVFYGHHPHVMQGIEDYNRSIIAYSLGNFCFDDVYSDKSSQPLIKQSENNKKSFILSIEIELDKVISYETIPLYAGDDKMIVGEDKTIIADLHKYSDFLESEKSLYNDYRNALLYQYLSNRKSKRDLKWYLKRLNLNSAIMILNALRNRKKYNKNVEKYIELDNA